MSSESALPDWMIAQMTSGPEAGDPLPEAGIGKGRSGERNRRTERKRGKYGLVRHGFLPVDNKRWRQPQNNACSDLFPKRR